MDKNKALQFDMRHWLALITILANVGLALPATRYGSAFALLWLLPGLAWARLLTARHRQSTETRPPSSSTSPRLRTPIEGYAEGITTGLGLGMSTVTLLTLLLHYIPGPLTLPTLLIATNLLILALILISPPPSPSGSPAAPGSSREPSRKPSRAIRPNSPRRSLGIWALEFGPLICHLSLVILIAAFFRLLHLGYSEFQGDEGIVMMRAARAILGDDGQLFYHQKGPAEVLLPMATWTLSGTINEWQARLPFALAGLLGIAALYLVGQRWFSRRSAFIGALLLAINGYFVGFGRIVQYQSLVLATTTLALLALWRWSEGGGRRWLLVGAALLASGLLAHYDAGMALPAAAYLVGRRLWNTRSYRLSEGPMGRWVDVVSAGGLAIGILALFYLPFARHPNFVKTVGYLRGARIGTEGPLYNHLISSLPLAMFYNSFYYLASLACLLVLASLRPFRRLGLLIPAAAYIAVILSSSNLLPPTWAGPVLAGLLIAILLSRRSTEASRAAWLWFGTPFLFYYFLVWEPRTHVLNAFPAAALLAGHVIDDLITHIPNLCRFADSLTRRFAEPQASDRRSLPLRYLAILLLLAIFLLLAYYPYLMFVQHNPEIKRTWPTHQPALYWRPNTQVPRFGYFGFPYRAGWKVIGDLIEEGSLSGVYASNEEQEVTGWYTRGAERTYCPNPEWYLIARNVQDEVPIHLSQSEISRPEATYHLWGEVQVGGETKLWIYHRGPAIASPTVLHVEDVEERTSRFDARSTPANVVPPPPADYVPAGHTLGEAVRLLGYRLDTADARPGGSVHLVLYWEALQPIETGYQVFNHLYDGTMWGQQDGTPGCALHPTTLWEPGQTIRDEYTIPIDPATPVGDIPLLVGMYSLDTGERLPVYTSDGIPIGDAIPLTTVSVRSEVRSAAQ